MRDRQAEVTPFSMSNFQLFELLERQQHHGEAFPSQSPESGRALVPLDDHEVTEVPKEGLRGVIELCSVLNVKEKVSHGGREGGDDFFEGDCYGFHHVRSIEVWVGQLKQILVVSHQHLDQTIRVFVQFVLKILFESISLIKTVIHLFQSTIQFLESRLLNCERDCFCFVVLDHESILGTGCGQGNERVSIRDSPRQTYFLN